MNRNIKLEVISIVRLKVKIVRKFIMIVNNHKNLMIIQIKIFLLNYKRKNNMIMILMIDHYLLYKIIKKLIKLRMKTLKKN